MSGDDLRAQAVAWFGERGWRTRLAPLLDVERSTLWRMVQNDAVPGPVNAAMRCWQKNGLPED